MENAPRPAEELWRRTLSRIPTTYGRLAYLASLRNPNSGVYHHHGLALLFGAEEADQAMRESHGLCFREWLAMTLEQQKADLELFLTSLPTDRKTLAENWLRLAPYRSIPPAWASDGERHLFSSDLETLLVLVRNEFSDEPPR
jgi:hypothetical protein